jgi:hypothetical protein
MDALEPFRVSSPKQDPTSYLQQKENILLIFILEVAIQPENATPTVLVNLILNICIGP